MSHPLQQKVRSVSRRARRLVLLYGIGWVVALVVGTAFVLGLVDYWLYRLLHFDDQGVRFICWAGVLSIAGLSSYFFLIPALRYRPSDVQTAQHIERRYPRLRDRLSSSIEFLSQAEDEVTAGSPALRRAVVAESTAALDRLDLHAAIDARGPRWSGLMALLVCAFVVGIATLDLNSARLAAKHLLVPWADEPWPRINALRIDTAPLRIAAGDNFEVAVIDGNGQLPDAVNLHVWFAEDSAEQIQVKEMKFLNGKMVYHLDNVTRPFRYRATGGDDQSMPWMPLEVVEPPRIESLQVTIHPPAYTGWPAEDASHEIRALEGSRIEISAKTSKPLSAAYLKSASDETVPPLDVRLDKTSMGFTFAGDPDQPWIVTGSGSYWFELIDRQQLKGGADRRLDVRCVTDHPPTVSLDKPSSNQYVTANAVVPLAAVVKDDLAIASIDLRYLDPHQSDQGEQSISLYRGSESAEKVGLASNRSSNDVRGDLGENQTISFPWDLAKLSGLQVGDSVELQIVASDYKPQTGHSTSRRLSIISPEELETRLAQRQGYILGQLAEALKIQRESRSQTTSLEIQLRETAGLKSQDIDQLQSAELNQRQVQRLLSDPNDGIESQITELLADLESNRLNSPDVKGRLTELLGSVHEIGVQQFPMIQRELINALKIARADLERNGALEPSDNREATESPIPALAEAGRRQDQVIASLERMLGGLSQWDNYRRFAREIAAIRNEQEDLQQRTTMRLGLGTLLNKNVAEFTPQERAELKRLAHRQMELALQFDRIQTRMEQMKDEVQDDPLAAETMADALGTARRLAISGQMRDSGSRIESNRIGQAMQSQQEILDHLDELLDVLANRREHELGRLVKKLREAADELSDLAQRQKGLRKKVQQASAIADQQQRADELQRLAKQQQELADQARNLSRRLQRLQAERSSAALSQAASELDSSAEAAQQSDSAAALEDAAQAQQDLEEAQQQLAERIRQAEQDLLYEEITRLEQEITGLIKPQQNVIDETVRLEGLRASQGRLSRGQFATLNDLADQQRSLAVEAGSLADKVAQAQAFQFGLQGAADDMNRAATRLDAHESGAEVQQAERNALNRLQQLLAALQPDAEAQQADAGGGSDGQPSGQEQAMPVDSIHALAELKLLKSMQQEINQRTIRFEEIRREKGSLTDEQQQELVELAGEQGRLAEVMLKLVPAQQPSDDVDGPFEPEGTFDEALEKSLEDAL